VIYVIVQSIETSLVMQLIIEMHTAHDYTIKKCIDIRTTGRPARRHLVRKVSLDDGPDDGSLALTRRLARRPVVFYSDRCRA